MFHVTLDNFQPQVILASQTVPVLLDLGSPRSPASQTLSTLLSRLETEYAGAFNLACANCDLIPQVAQAFQVQAVPTVILIVNGQPIDGFSGSITEVAVREFLNKHVPALADKTTETPEITALVQAQEALQTQNFDAAITYCKAALAANPDFVPARVLLAELLLDTHPFIAQLHCEAARTQTTYPLDTETMQQLDGLMVLIGERLLAHQASLDTPEVAHLKQLLDSNPKNLEARLALATIYQTAQAFDLAVEQLLWIVNTDRTFGDDIGRKTMLLIFAAASEMPNQVRQWRQQLSMALN